MKAKKYQKIVKITAFLFWLLIIASALVFYFSKNIPLSEYPNLIKGFLRKQALWAPVLYLIFHILRSFLFFPTSILEGMAGLLFGPWWGLLINYIGVNISSNIVFFVVRILGHDFIEKKEIGRLKKFDKKIEENGFITIFVMRIAYLPFDLVNYAAGLSSIKFKDYFSATLLSTLIISPPIVILGASVDNHLNLYYAGGFLLLSSIFIFFARKIKR